MKEKHKADRITQCHGLFILYLFLLDCTTQQRTLPAHKVYRTPKFSSVPHHPPRFPQIYHKGSIPIQSNSFLSVKDQRNQKEICSISCNVLPCLATAKTQATQGLLLNLSNFFSFQIGVSITMFQAPWELRFTLCSTVLLFPNSTILISDRHFW